MQAGLGDSFFRETNFLFLLPWGRVQDVIASCPQLTAVMWGTQLWLPHGPFLFGLPSTTSSLILPGLLMAALGSTRAFPTMPPTPHTAVLLHWLCLLQLLVVIHSAVWLEMECQLQSRPWRLFILGWSFPGDFSACTLPSLQAPL